MESSLSGQEEIIVVQILMNHMFCFVDDVEVHGGVLCCVHLLSLLSVRKTFKGVRVQLQLPADMVLTHDSRKKHLLLDETTFLTGQYHFKGGIRLRWACALSQ